MSHPIVHVELSAANRQEAGKWYADLFGWSIQDFPEMSYTTFKTTEDGLGGGFNSVQDGYPAGTVTFYIHTDDVNAHLAKIEAKGGKTVMPGMEVLASEPSVRLETRRATWSA